MWTSVEDEKRVRSVCLSTCLNDLEEAENQKSMGSCPSFICKVGR